MGKAKEPNPAKLFMSLITSEDEFFGRGMKDLSLAFGEIDFMSHKYAFQFTDYYMRGDGERPLPSVHHFRRLISIPLLPDIKANDQSSGRKICDSGRTPSDQYRSGISLFGACDPCNDEGYTHRPYLREGIYADLTLIYRNKSYQPLEWTYPDYRQEEVIGLFNQFRKTYVEDLKGGHSSYVEIDDGLWTSRRGDTLGRVCVETRSVNHRYCDINIKLPRRLSPFETRIKELIRSQVSRGRIDISLKVDSGE